MQFEKSIIIILIATCLLMIGAVSATSAANNTLESSDVTSDNSITNQEINNNPNDNNDNYEKKSNENSLEETEIQTEAKLDIEKPKVTNTKEKNMDDYTTKLNSPTKTNKLSFEEEYLNFTYLNKTMTDTEDVLNLNINFKFNNTTDTDLKEIKINKTNFVINGNYHVIDANNANFTFKINGENVTINNLIFKNSMNFIITVVNIITNNVTFENCINNDTAPLKIVNSTYTSNNDKFINNQGLKGASINSKSSTININNGLFENKKDIKWSSIYATNSNLTILNTNFTNMTSKYATAIYGENCKSYINNSRFINLFANITAGALGFKENTSLTIENCEFINVSSNKNAGAIFIDINGMIDDNHGTIIISNAVFINCSSEFGGAYLQLGGNLKLNDSNFTDNYAEFNGGALYFSDTNSLIENCIFKSNNVNITDENYPRYGGAIFFDNGQLNITDSEFINNLAHMGSGIYSYDSEYHLHTLKFNNNSNHAIYTFFDSKNSTKSDIYGITINIDDFDNEYYPSLVTGAGMQLRLINNTQNITSIPQKYDLRDEGLVSPVKNQGHMGACWAFGKIASLESALLKALNHTFDFSENNMQNSMLKYSQYGSNTSEGGHDLNSNSYLLSWFGAFPQDYDSYDELGKISPLIKTLKDIHIQDIIIIPYTLGDNNSMNTVKQAILKYGALSGGLYYSEEYYNNNTSSEYTPNDTEANHEICVVGWDDDYPRNNFLDTPPGDGAWIIKNSWGTNWGDKGYFYVSYYDKTLCTKPDTITECFFGIVLENTNPYNNNYQYDLSNINGFDTDGSQVSYLNNFESYSDDMIAAVGTYFNMEGVEYTIEISVNDNLVYTQTGVSPYYGYHTIKLNNYISIKEGDKISALIKSNAVPICNDSRVHYKKGSSLKYSNGTWKDLTEKNTVACLKVYTLPNQIKTDNLKITNINYEPFIVEVNETNANITVSINNNILNAITNENGIAKFKLQELDNGNYTITTTYNKTTVINTVEVNIDFYKIIKEQTETIKNQNQLLNKTKEELKTAQNQIKKLTTEIKNLNNKITNTSKQTTKIIANKKTYKAKTKTKKYTITLKSGKTLPKNLKVTLKIKGRTYTTKTNKKGKATFKITKLNKKGTYTTTITFKGNNNYKASQKTVKIIIK